MSAQAVADRSRFRQVLAEMAEKAKVKLPDSASRIAKAVALVLNGDIAYDPTTSTARVNRCTDATKVYRVRGKGCECPDYERAPQQLCKHLLATMFMLRIEQVLASEAPPISSDTNEKDITTNGSLGEAPASVNLRVLLYGHECQITLRDAQEDRLLTRLEALLADTRIKPLPKPAPRPGQGKPRRYQGA
jgi:hypothetical protein